jgi:hypothetical protein
MPQASADELSKSDSIDSLPLLVIHMAYPPLDVKGYYADGIEYYYCSNFDCRSLWAVQWSTRPRKKIVYECLDLEGYKLVAISKDCGQCKAVVQGEAVKHKSLQQSPGHARERTRDPSVMPKRPSGRRVTQAEADPIDEFKDVRLTPSPDLKENPTLLAARDPSWDVVDEDDVNEDWAIINHFGNPVLQHRDAHVDTPTVRS